MPMSVEKPWINVLNLSLDLRQVMTFLGLNFLTCSVRPRLNDLQSNFQLREDVFNVLNVLSEQGGVELVMEVFLKAGDISTCSQKLHKFH